MGLCLIAAVTWNLSLLGTILEVAVALGMVIFVHELGHFVVAKLCGVKCEKFYLGFDIGGLKLCKVRWGETEYGIGILPLGGYVKMLGQEDNPAKLREEIERAKQQSGDPQAAAAAAPAEQAVKPDEVAAAERALFDPRSYLAQSVPKRMAIISAGVIMNVIFAFVCATVAYRLGVKQISSGVGAVVPGEAAWKAGIRVGDRIDKISGHDIERFTDIMRYISLGDNIAEGVPLLVRRPGLAEPLKFTVVPDRIRLAPTIGVGNPWSTTLDSQRRPTIPGTPAALAKPKFQSGDTIVAIDRQPVESYAQIEAYLAEHPKETIDVIVKRSLDKHVGNAEAEGDTEATVAGGDQPGAATKSGATTAPNVVPGAPGSAGGTRLLGIAVAPRPMRELGLQMAMGEICAIQTDSPAAKAGLREGDLIQAIDGKPVADPMRLPAQFRESAEKTVTLTVQREGSKTPLELSLSPRRVDWFEEPLDVGKPMSVPQLGIAYRVLNRVAGVVEGSPAANAGMRAGDVVLKATILPPDEETVKKHKLEQKAATLSFSEKPTERNWPFFCDFLQNVYPGSRVELQLEGNRSVTLEPVPAADWFNPDRGFRFDPEEFTQTATTWGAAVKLGGRETVDALTMVVAVLQKIGTQISFRNLGGPGMIAAAAGHAANEGFASLLIFLTLISANLAVLNFLPIPLLDGGHMIFLAWEGIRGKPADERVQSALTYLGLIFILALMIWVIGLDITRFFFRGAW